MRPILAAAFAAALALPANARAQEAEPRPQQRVRVILARQPEVEGAGPSQVIRGTLLAIDADSMTVQVHPGTGPLRVSREVVRRMYVSRGVPSRTQSAAVGAVSWAVLGALTVWSQNQGDDPQFSSDRDAALTGAAVGAGLGLVTGAFFPHERWHRVRLPARVTVAPALRQGDGWTLAIAR
jgi:hypothetical protein